MGGGISTAFLTTLLGIILGAIYLEMLYDHIVIGIINLNYLISEIMLVVVLPHLYKTDGQLKVPSNDS